MNIKKLNEEIKKVLNEESDNEVHFATKEAETLWNHEVTGQLSDGHWENARPDNHYKFWTSANVITDGQIGYKGYPRKTNYNILALAGSDLNLMPRMRAYIGAVKLNKDPDLAFYVIKFPNQMKNPGSDNYWIERSNKVKKEFGDDIDKAKDELLQAAAEKDVKTALKEIAQMMRTKLN